MSDLTKKIWKEYISFAPLVHSDEAIQEWMHDILIAKAKSLNLSIRLRTFQENLGARRFYEQHGFKIIEFSDGSGNEEHYPDMLYELEIKTH